jgi:DNA-binding response OmpR family regulator
LLTRAGCDAQAAFNVESVLRLAQRQWFNLITIDVEMPGLNGFELFKHLKQIPYLAETPIIFVSSHATIENQQYALGLGAVDFIEKPFNAQDFVSRILSCISHSQAQCEFRSSNVFDKNADTDTQSLCNTP